MSRRLQTALLSLSIAAAFSPAPALAQTAGKKPNILVMFGDDIGFWNVSIYNRGMMGYRTPNIDRIAKEGAIFTDVYAQQSCTAGRAAFITGQSPIRTGLLKVGLPGAPEGLSDKDPTIANLLKGQGYATGQFGKNHLGDRNEFIPTVHGFDEFFGNFYHLNAEQEPENPDYPKDPKFKERFGPRGVFHCYATDAASTLPDDGRFGKWGKQRCEDTGPLTKKRMETIDEEVLAETVKFIDAKQQEGKPWFVWFNTTRMHIFTHLKAESQGKTGLGLAPDGMVEHDGHIGQLLKKLDDLKSRREHDRDLDDRQRRRGDELARRRHDAVPRREEHQLGGRLPRAARGALARRDQARHRDQRDHSHEDWLPTLLAAAGQPDVKESLLKGLTAAGATYKVHLDGYNLMPALKGETKEWPRKEFVYWTDDGAPAALRFEQWKMVFLEQRAIGLEVWQDPLVELRFPKLFTLRADPFERADREGMDYRKWRLDRAFLLGPAQGYVARWMQSFKDFPPRQKPGSFNLSHVMAKLTKPAE